MSTLIQHAELMIRMKKCGLRSELIKKFSLQDIINSCNRIEDSDLKKFNYSGYYLIQEELIRDENIIKPIQLAFKGKYNIENFQTFLSQIKTHNEKMSNYNYRNIIKVLNHQKLKVEAYYVFLKYYINENYEIRKKAINNLNYFYSQNKVQFDELTENEINLIKYHLLDNTNLIPIINIKEIYELLVTNKDLLELIDYLNESKLYIPLNLKRYQIINKNSKEIGTYIRKIYFKIKDNEIMYQLLLKWLENDCSIYDLKVFDSKTNDMNNNKIEKVVQNRTSYINFIYGNRLKKFALDSIYGRKEDLIIYAIKEKKNNFLKIIENNMKEFLEIPINSILYHESFYSVYTNLNEITLKDLIKLRTMNYDINSKLDLLEKQKFTFDEISILYNASEKYIKLYNEFLELKVDDRILRIRQLMKKDLLNIDINDFEIQLLAEKLKEKPLYSWLEVELNKIKDILISDVVQVLIRYEKIKKFLSEIKNRSELSYVLRNYNNIEKYANLQAIKNDLENIDKYWINLKSIMNYSDDFINKYKENINDFLINNGAELAYEYYKDQSIEQKEAFKLIIKAVIMGEFQKLKYHTDDLQKEIDYKLEEYQIKEWSKTNIELNEEKYNIKEYDDFYHTMFLGEYPKRTCLNYKNGSYNSCLLACFDSNKKILYAKINGKIIARAMVRLTKGTYTRVKNKLKSLTFVDVENETKQENNNNQENLTLFLERPYIGGISDKSATLVKRLFVKLLKEKAKKMNALLVLSNDYYEINDEQFIFKPYYMYISKSKSSSQYLDSLSGEATVSDVGEYKENSFLIWKPIEKKENNIFESIFIE